MVRHISAAPPGDPSRYLLARSAQPGADRASDILEFSLDQLHHIGRLTRRDA